MKAREKRKKIIKRRRRIKCGKERRIICLVSAAAEVMSDGTHP